MERGDIVDFSGQPHIVLEVSEDAALLYHRYLDENGSREYPDVLSEEHVRDMQELESQGGKFMFWVPKKDISPWWFKMVDPRAHAIYNVEALEAGLTLDAKRKEGCRIYEVYGGTFVEDQNGLRFVLLPD